MHDTSYYAPPPGQLQHRRQTSPPRAARSAQGYFKVESAHTKMRRQTSPARPPHQAQSGGAYSPRNPQQPKFRSDSVRSLERQRSRSRSRSPAKVELKNRAYSPKEKYEDGGNPYLNQSYNPYVELNQSGMVSSIPPDIIAEQIGDEDGSFTLKSQSIRSARSRGPQEAQTMHDFSFRSRQSRQSRSNFSRY